MENHYTIRKSPEEKEGLERDLTPYVEKARRTGKIDPDDHPALGAIVKRYFSTEELEILNAIVTKKERSTCLVENLPEIAEEEVPRITRSFTRSLKEKGLKINSLAQAAYGPHIALGVYAAISAGEAKSTVVLRKRYRNKNTGEKTLKAVGRNWHSDNDLTHQGTTAVGTLRNSEDAKTSVVDMKDVLDTLSEDTLRQVRVGIYGEKTLLDVKQNWSHDYPESIYKTRLYREAFSRGGNKPMPASNPDAIAEFEREAERQAISQNIQPGQLFFWSDGLLVHKAGHGKHEEIPGPLLRLAYNVSAKGQEMQL